MHKTKTALWISLLTLGLFFALSGKIFAEVIHDFHSDITVSADSSILVTEKITYDFGELSRHGIFRTIPLRNAQNNPIIIKDIAVTDENEKAYEFTTSTSHNILTIKIGDPDTTVQGVKEYNITYRVEGSVGYFDTYDELYWNVTGSDWQVQIEKASAHVFLPGATAALQKACYFGAKGDTEQCIVSNDNSFSVPQVFFPGTQLTIAVGFPKGTVALYNPPVHSPLSKLAQKFWPILIPLIAFLGMFQKWYRKGRDPKGRAVIVPEYEVPDNLTPLEAAIILNQKIAPRDIVAEILYLATKGYISIARTEERSFLSKKVEYTIRLEKIPGNELSIIDKEILVTLFTPAIPNPLSLTLSQIRKLAPRKHDPDVTSLSIGTEVSLTKNGQCIGLQQVTELRLRQCVVDKGYYTKDFAPKNIFVKKSFLSIAALFGVYVLFQTTHLFQKVMTALFSRADDITIILFVFSVMLTIIIVALFSSIMPAKTEKGIRVKQSLLGLKEYIEVAEKDRIDFHNAPERNPVLFEHLLPYAIMFGQEKKWAKAFDSVVKTPPSWYRGDTHNFTAVAFTSSLTNTFSSSFYSSMGSNSSGSGGGGFSGGGGGGGGGGSW